MLASFIELRSLFVKIRKFTVTVLILLFSNIKFPTLTAGFAGT